MQKYTRRSLVLLAALTLAVIAPAGNAAQASQAATAPAAASPAVPGATLPPGLPACHYPQADDGQPIKVAASLQSPVVLKTAVSSSAQSSDHASSTGDGSSLFSLAIPLGAGVFLFGLSVSVAVKKRRSRR